LLVNEQYIDSIMHGATIKVHEWCVVLFRWSVSSALSRFEHLLWVMDKNQWKAQKRRLAPTVRVGLISFCSY
jgi:hypothetical protein